MRFLGPMGPEETQAVRWLGSLASLSKGRGAARVGAPSPRSQDLRQSLSNRSSCCGQWCPRRWDSALYVYKKLAELRYPPLLSEALNARSVSTVGGQGSSCQLAMALQIVASLAATPARVEAAWTSWRSSWSASALSSSEDQIGNDAKPATSRREGASRRRPGRAVLNGDLDRLRRPGPLVMPAKEPALQGFATGRAPRGGDANGAARAPNEKMECSSRMAEDSSTLSRSPCRSSELQNPPTMASEKATRASECRLNQKWLWRVVWGGVQPAGRNVRLGLPFLSTFCPELPHHRIGTRVSPARTTAQTAGGSHAANVGAHERIRFLFAVWSETATAGVSG